MKKIIVSFLVIGCLSCTNATQNKALRLSSVLGNKEYPELDTMVWRGNEPIDKALFAQTKRFLDTSEVFIKAGFEKTKNRKSSQKEVARLMDSVFKYTGIMQGIDSIVFKDYRKARLEELLNWMVQNGYTGK
ncbi:hypothetical protein [Niabella sp.]|uniref:hypothetical protein n=1 Tax=Niabella sp. TaxID=1962976 RepID=UPI002610A350|nr:hypothetical protein [Niabella sp.]